MRTVDDGSLACTLLCFGKKMIYLFNLNLSKLIPSEKRIKTNKSVHEHMSDFIGFVSRPRKNDKRASL